MDERPKRRAITRQVSQQQSTVPSSNLPFQGYTPGARFGPPQESAFRPVNPSPQTFVQPQHMPYSERNFVLRQPTQTVYYGEAAQIRHNPQVPYVTESPPLRQSTPQPIHSEPLPQRYSSPQTSPKQGNFGAVGTPTHSPTNPQQRSPPSARPITAAADLSSLGAASSMYVDPNESHELTDALVSNLSNMSLTLPDEIEEDTDEEEDDGMTHPNKFPVEIEYHENRYCLYKRQGTRSGLKQKQSKTDPKHHIKYYQKDLVRICRCGKYSQMDGALVHGRANDCDGYEIHYSQKCKWKAYDDFKTGKRVLIRLCKCYKPML